MSRHTRPAGPPRGLEMGPGPGPEITLGPRHPQESAHLPQGVSRLQPEDPGRAGGPGPAASAGAGACAPSEQALLGPPLSWVTGEGTVAAAHARPHPSSPAAAMGPLNQLAPGLFTFYESVRALGKKKKGQASQKYRK